VCIDCNGVPYNEYSVAYYRPFTDHQFEYYGWMGRPIYQRMYEPVRLTNHSFFHTLTCQETDYDNIYNNCNWEYTVREGKYLKFNFERGMVALSYLRSITDEKGYPMIPDDYTFLTAITAYITLRHMKRKMYTEAKRENITMAQSAQADWDKYVRMAVNKALSPQGIDEYENLKDQRLYLIPRRNAYQNFFGNLNRKEIKNTMHTESRNNAGRVFRRFPV